MLGNLTKPWMRAREVVRKGDDTPAASVFHYTWRMSGWHQVAVCLLAVAIAPLNLAPVELQRRIVDGIAALDSVETLMALGLVYLALVLVHQIAKYLLRLSQAWLSESAVLYTRGHLLKIHGRRPGPERVEDSGPAVSVIGAEVDKLAEFVGTGPSQACANIVTLLVIVGYMLYVQPSIALLAFALLVPQAVLIPLIQQRLNKLTMRRVDLLRALGDGIASTDPDWKETSRRELPEIYRNKMRFSAIKFAMKGPQNGLAAVPVIAILVWGGHLVIDGQATIGTVVAFITGYERTRGPFRELIAFYRTAAQANVHHNKIGQWM